MVDMAVRQYVGARYTPKFYENSQNASLPTWEANTAYEALTIVTYNNSSYTSKIPVPATVGNPAQNPTYWALTGDYNAQVEAYREETVAVQESLNEEIQNRENADNELQTSINNSGWWGAGKTIVVYGDSTSVIATSWSHKLSGATVTNRGVSGYSIQQCLEVMKNNNDNNNFDYIIFAAGINNWQANAYLAAIIQPVQEVCEYLSSLTNPVPIYITPMFSYSDQISNPTYGMTEHGGSLEYLIRAINTVTKAYGIATYNPYWTCGVNINNYTEFMTQSPPNQIYVHENEKLGTIMATQIKSFDFSSVVPEDTSGYNMLNVAMAKAGGSAQIPKSIIDASSYGDEAGNYIFMNKDGVNVAVSSSPDGYIGATETLEKGTTIKIQGKFVNTGTRIIITKAGTPWIALGITNGYVLCNILITETAEYGAYLQFSGGGYVLNAGVYFPKLPTVQVTNSEGEEVGVLKLYADHFEFDHDALTSGNYTVPIFPAMYGIDFHEQDPNINSFVVWAQNGTLRITQDTIANTLILR